MAPVIPRAARALAAAAAEAAVQEVLVDPSHETLHAVSLASAAAAAATAVHYGSAARASAQEPSASSPSRPCQSTDQLAGRSTASRNEPTEPDLRPASRPPQRPRKTKVTLTLGDKIELIRMYDSGVHTWRSLQEAFPKEISRSVARRTCEPRERARILKRARAGEPLDATRTRRSKFEEIDASLKTWFDGIESMGGEELPMTMAVLETRAREIATDLGVEGFVGSPGFIQRWASRHRLKSVKLWGQAGSAAEAVRKGERRMAEIRSDLADYDPENIYNMDETGLQYRCLPSRTYIAAGRRRRVRGSKAMKAKDRVTLVLACNATGSHKIPVAIIGCAAVPQCFKPPREGCPLPYFSQQSAWMDGTVYEKWFKTVFVPNVRSRTRSPVILVVDNCGAHTKIECDGVTICPLPPNVTSVHQPLDAGIIACLKRRYKRRLISLVLGALPEKRRRQEAAAGVAPAASTAAANSNAAAAEATAQAPCGTATCASRSAMPVATGTAPGTVLGDGAGMDWAPPSSLATGVGSSGTGIDASLAARPGGISQLVGQPGAPPLAGRFHASHIPASAMEAVAPPFTTPPLVTNTALTSSLPPTPLSSTSGAAASSYAPPIVDGLPGPTSRDLALAASPNVWVEPPAAPPPTPNGAARPNPRRSRRRAAPPRPVLGVRDGAAAHLGDVAQLILEEWEAVSPSTIAHCWAKACILPLAMEARLLADHGEYRASSRCIADEVREIIGMMGTCGIAQECFGEGDAAEKELVVEGWLGLEDDLHAIEDTVDVECATERASGQD